MSGRGFALAGAMSLLLLGGCGGSESGSTRMPPPAGLPEVFVANHPLQYMVERIAGERVRILFPVPADEDPAFWSPDAEGVARIQQADLILLNGAGYSPWVDRVTLPDRVVNTSAGSTEDLLALEESVTHSHGPEGEHAHSGYAFTTWLDLAQAIRQADAVRQALTDLLPDSSADLQTSFESLRSDLETLDRELATVLAEAPAMVASHPVFQYLERRYHLDIRSVHWEPDQEPSEEQWQELAVLQEQQPAPWMLWEGRPLPFVEARLQESGMVCVVFEPCANRPREGDLLTTLRRNLEHLRQALAAERD